MSKNIGVLKPGLLMQTFVPFDNLVHRIPNGHLEPLQLIDVHLPSWQFIPSGQGVVLLHAKGVHTPFAQPDPEPKLAAQSLSLLHVLFTQTPARLQYTPVQPQSVDNSHLLPSFAQVIYNK